MEPPECCPVAPQPPGVRGCHLVETQAAASQQCGEDQAEQETGVPKAGRAHWALPEEQAAPSTRAHCPPRRLGGRRGQMRAGPQPGARPRPAPCVCRVVCPPLWSGPASSAPAPSSHPLPELHSEGLLCGHTRCRPAPLLTDWGGPSSQTPEEDQDLVPTPGGSASHPRASKVHAGYSTQQG